MPHFDLTDAAVREFRSPAPVPTRPLRATASALGSADRGPAGPLWAAYADEIGWERKGSSRKRGWQPGTDRVAPVSSQIAAEASRGQGSIRQPGMGRR